MMKRVYKIYDDNTLFIEYYNNDGGGFFVISFYSISNIGIISVSVSSNINFSLMIKSVTDQVCD